jgi:4-hydroxy-tetrahydrodipicolinate synthase
VGDETLILEALDAGWTGTISGAANVVPDWLRQVVHGFGSERTSAEVKFELIKPALQALRKSPQPATSKAVLHRLGVLPTAMPRLPVLPVEDAVTEAVMAGLSGLRQVTR